MKTFSQYLSEVQETREKLLAEGGNAIKSVEVSKIYQENVPDTLREISKNLLKPLGLELGGNARSLGSTGKKKLGSTSGDIDIAVDANHLMKQLKAKDTVDLASKLQKFVERKTPEAVILPGNSIVSFAFPISNINEKQESMFVQVDFMITPDVEYAEFAFHSPKEVDSAYKGLHRNKMFHAVAFYHFYKRTLEKDGEEVEFERGWFDSHKGLMFGKQSRQGARKLLKKPKTISREVVERTPDRIIQTLFGPKANRKTVDSFETMYKAVMSSSFPNAKYRKEILKWAKEAIESEKAIVPKELENV